MNQDRFPPTLQFQSLCRKPDFRHIWGEIQNLLSSRVTPVHYLAVLNFNTLKNISIRRSLWGFLEGDNEIGGSVIWSGKAHVTYYQAWIRKEKEKGERTEAKREKKTNRGNKKMRKRKRPGDRKKRNIYKMRKKKWRAEERKGRWVRQRPRQRPRQRECKVIFFFSYLVSGGKIRNHRSSGAKYLKTCFLYSKV